MLDVTKEINYAIFYTFVKKLLTMSLVIVIEIIHFIPDIMKNFFNSKEFTDLALI